jgi:hypothetical protein
LVEGVSRPPAGLTAAAREGVVPGAAARRATAGFLALPAGDRPAVPAAPEGFAFLAAREETLFGG